MATELPTVPRWVFTIIEPILLVGGFLVPVFSPKVFISSQLPRSSMTESQSVVLDNIVAYDATATLLAWQLGNAYLLLGLLGVFILNTTTELKVVRAYLWALWLGDIGHVGISLYSMGIESLKNMGEWNAVVWGNTGITVFLFLMRSAYFAGLFDDEQPAVETKEE